MQAQTQSEVGGPAVDGEHLDREDMRRLAGGGDSALNRLMERHSGKLFNYLMRLLHNEEDANEVAQETFVRVYQKRKEFDAEKKFLSWFYAIATNLARDRLRWRKRHPEVSMDAEDSETGQSLGAALPAKGPSPSEVVTSEERGKIVRRAVERLPENWRVPLILAEFEGRSHIEIGEILSCSPKAVEMRIARARKELRETLAGLLNALA